MKKILATVSAVVLSLAMVAMPSIAMADEVESTETVTTETVTTETVATETVATETVTEPETTEPETTEPETTEPETTEPETPAEPAEGDTTETDTIEGDPLLERTAFQTGETHIVLDLELEVDGTAVHQVCEESGDESVGTLVPGSIQLTVSDLNGVANISYSKDGGTISDVNLATLLVENLEPGKYDFVVVEMPGYESVNDFSVTVKADNDPDCKKQTICHWNEGGGGSYNVIDVSIKSIINVPNGHETHENDIIPAFFYYDGDDLKFFAGLNTGLEVEGCDEIDLPTEGPVIPEVMFTPGTCEADGSYQLISPAESEDVPAGTVTWFVNDVETPEGTYPLAAGVVVTVKVVANFVDFPLDIDGDILTEYTYDPYSFAAPTDCALDTLALTGAEDTTPALALTAFLGLLGLAMVRSGIRVNRTRQEA
jgi:hypothetical protein